MIRSSERRRSWPTDEPRADPTCTIGPSRPAEPPVPMHSADAAILAMATRGRMRPPFRTRACITSGTPCPFASGANQAIIGPAIRAPTTGTMINARIPYPGSKEKKAAYDPCWTYSMNLIKKLRQNRWQSRSEQPGPAAAGLQAEQAGQAGRQPISVFSSR